MSTWVYTQRRPEFNLYRIVPTATGDRHCAFFEKKTKIIETNKAILILWQGIKLTGEIFMKKIYVVFTPESDTIVKVITTAK